MFKVTLSAPTVALLPQVAPPPAPVGLGVRLVPPGVAVDLVAAIQARPSFFQRFDTVLVDYRHYLDTSLDRLRAEHEWLRLQVRAWVSQ